MVGENCGLLLSAVLLLALLVSGCTAPMGGGMYVMKDAYRSNLSFSKVPVLNEEVELVLTINPVFNVSNVTVQFLLDNGIQLISEKSSFFDEKLYANTEIPYKIIVKIIKIGDFSIETTIDSVAYLPEYDSYTAGSGRLKKIYLHATEESIIVSKNPITDYPQCIGTLQEIEQCMRTESTGSAY